MDRMSKWQIFFWIRQSGIFFLLLRISKMLTKKNFGNTMVVIWYRIKNFTFLSHLFPTYPIVGFIVENAAPSKFSPFLAHTYSLYGIYRPTYTIQVWFVVQVLVLLGVSGKFSKWLKVFWKYLRKKVKSQVRELKTTYTWDLLLEAVCSKMWKKVESLEREKFHQ